MRNQRTHMVTVERLEDIPQFKSEREESNFWATHELSERLWNKAETLPEGLLPPARPRTRPVAIRFDDATLERLKRLSAHLHKGYQSLLKEFVVERLYEEERREGFIKSLRHAPRPSRSTAGFAVSASPVMARGEIAITDRDLRRQRNGAISREEYATPILQYLATHGGRASTEDVCDAVAMQFEAHFTKADLQSRRSTPGEPVWRNEVRWAAKTLKTRGLVHETATTGRGTWAITDAGREFLDSGGAN